MPSATPSTTRRRKAATAAAKPSTVRTSGSARASGTGRSSTTAAKAAKAVAKAATHTLPVFIPETSAPANPAVVAPAAATNVRRRVTGIAVERPSRKTAVPVVEATPPVVAAPVNRLPRPQRSQRTAQALLEAEYGGLRGTATNEVIERAAPHVVEAPTVVVPQFSPPRPAPTFRPSYQQPAEEDMCIDPEELFALQKEFVSGRSEVMQDLRSLVASVDAECVSLDQRIQHLRQIRTELKSNFDRVNDLDPEQWNPQDLVEEMNVALGIISKVQRSHEVSKLQVERLLQQQSTVKVPTVKYAPAEELQGDAEDTEKRSFWEVLASKFAEMAPKELSAQTFKTWAFCGLAFCVPVVLILGLVYLVKAFF